MKKLIVILTILLSVNNLNAQMDFPPPPEVLLMGAHPFADLIGSADYAWFDKGVMSYPPTPAYVDSIRKFKKPYTIFVVGGTWCDDTQKLLPQLYAVLKTAGKKVDTDVSLYFVDHDKKSPEGTEGKYNIINIPTIIVQDKNKAEVGRIVESVKVSMETDLYQILKKIK